MPTPPAVNPDVHDIADRAKYGYAIATQELAALQYRLGELAGTGQIHPDESMSLQRGLARVWESLYWGTLCAIRDEDTDDLAWDEDGNTYSDGRTVMTQIRIEPWETSVLNWVYNRFIFGEGAVNEHRRGTISCIAHHDAKRDCVANDPPLPTSIDSESLRARLRERLAELRDKASPAERDGESEIE
jgi:hypothetical protein